MRKNLKFEKIALNQEFGKLKAVKAVEAECVRCGTKMPKAIYVIKPRCVGCQLEERTSLNGWLRAQALSS